MSADHVVIREQDFHCAHCGASEPMSLPVEVRLLVMRSEAFVARHRACKAAALSKTETTAGRAAG